jgi:hypothetical protein
MSDNFIYITPTSSHVLGLIGEAIDDNLVEAIDESQDIVNI